MEQSEQAQHKGHKGLIITSVCLLIAVILVFFYWLFWLRLEEYTDDAYVHGNLVELTPQISGIVRSINADETDYVTQDQVIVELDRTDNQLAFEQSQAELAETVRNVVKMFQNVEKLKAEVMVREAQLIRSEQDYENRVNLVDIGGVSKENFEHVEANLRSSISSLSMTKHELMGALALVENTTVKTHPLVNQAKDKLKEAWVNLQRCNIVAPVDGFIAKRTVQVGESVAPNDPLLAIIPLNELWVDANYKEVQLSKMRIGQRVKMHSDIYGHKIIYHGRVLGISAGTGAVFSALPPQNATGNWIKIVQRLPVRVSLDPEELQTHPLRVGLSMRVTVDISDTSGPMLSKAKKLKPLYYTDVYAMQEEGVEGLIEKIIEENQINQWPCNR